MSRTFDSLVCFSVYSLIILIIGKSSFGESDSIGKFFIGERKCGFWRLFSTFVGTWGSWYLKSNGSHAFQTGHPHLHGYDV